MALKKTIELESGITVEYFRLSQLNINGDQASFILEGYINQSARENGKQPIYEAGNSGMIPYDKSKVDESPFAQAYTKIKTLPSWADAEDC